MKDNAQRMATAKRGGGSRNDIAEAKLDKAISKKQRKTKNLFNNTAKATFENSAPKRITAKKDPKSSRRPSSKAANQLF